MLESVFTTHSDSLITQFLIKRRDQMWRIIQLKKELGLSPTTITKSIKRLLEYRIIREEDKKYTIDLTTEVGLNLVNFELSLVHQNQDKVNEKWEELTSA